MQLATTSVFQNIHFFFLIKLYKTIIFKSEPFDHTLCSNSKLKIVGNQIHVRLQKVRGRQNHVTSAIRLTTNLGFSNTQLQWFRTPHTAALHDFCSPCHGLSLSPWVASTGRKLGSWLAFWNYKSWSVYNASLFDPQLRGAWQTSISLRGSVQSRELWPSWPQLKQSSAEWTGLQMLQGEN